ncbi:MAG: hypothetical protein HY554_12550 [Elusimicrobia bacterium]|nr:hypothetical protein [Elusimicrobiota bacterium]
MMAEGFHAPGSVPGKRLAAALLAAALLALAWFGGSRHARSSRTVRPSADGVQDYLGDYPGRLDLITAVAGNSAYPCSVRAQALQYVGDSFANGPRSRDWAERVFDRKPYSSDLRAARGDPWKAAARVYDRSADLCPRPASHFRAAEWRAEELLNDRTRRHLDAETKARYLREAKSRLERGNRAWDCLSEAPMQRAYAHWVRGVVEGHLFLLEGGSEHRIGAEADFKRAIILLAGTRDGPRSGQVPWVHLYYAAFLHAAYGDDRREEIRDALERVTSAKTAATAGFLAVLAREKTQYAHWRATLQALAKVDRRLRRLLKEKRWSL